VTYCILVLQLKSYDKIIRHAYKW